MRGLNLKIRYGIWQAAMEDDLQTVKNNIDNALDNSEMDTLYNTNSLFSHALNIHHTELLIIFIQQFPGLGQMIIDETQNKTLLHWAAQHAHANLIHCLLDLQLVGINVEGQHGTTPLHYAIQNGHTDIVALLLQKGANVYAMRDHDVSTLLEAVYHTQGAIATLLLERMNQPQDIEHYINPALGAACRLGKVDIAILLLGQGGNPNGIDDKQCPFLCAAIQQGQYATTALLLHQGAYINTGDARGCTPLHYAMEFDHPVLAALLIERGAAITTDAEGYTPFDRCQYRSGTSAIDFHALYQAMQQARPVNPRIYHILWQTFYSQSVEHVKQSIADIDADVLAAHDAAIIFETLKDNLPFLCVFVEKFPIFSTFSTHRRMDIPLVAWAATQGYVELLSSLLHHGLSNINCSQSDGNTPLHLAVRNGHAQAVALLLENGALATALIQIKTNYYTPLEMAIAYHQQEVVILLLKHLIEKDPIHTYRYLKIACVQGALPVVKEILQKGIDLRYAQTKSKPLLYLASQHGHLEIVRLLLESGVHPHAVCYISEDTALHGAMKGNYFEIALLLLEHGAKITYNKNTQTPFACPHTVSQHDLPFLRKIHEILQSRRQQEARMAAQNRESFHSALWTDIPHIVLIRTLLRSDNPHCHTIDMHYIPPQKSSSILERAMQLNPAALLLFVESCPAIGTINIHPPSSQEAFYQTTLLHWAADNGDVRLVSQLLEKGLQAIPIEEDFINIKQQDGSTPLHLAAGKGHLLVVNLLLQHGADIYKRNYAWETPLMVAARHNVMATANALCQAAPALSLMERLTTFNNAHSYIDEAMYLAYISGASEIAMLLLRSGGNPHYTRNTQEDPLLHLASEKNDTAMVRLLLHKKVRIDATCPAGQTALHRAVRKGHLGITTLLLEHGAAIRTDNKGRTPFSLKGPHEEPFGSQAREIYDTLQLRNMTEEQKNLVLQHRAINRELWQASHDNNSTVVKKLIHHPYANLSFTHPSNETTAFMTAVYYHHLPVITVFIEEYAFLSFTTDPANNTSLLHWAAKHDYIDLATLLLEKKPYLLHAKEYNGTTPLHLAVGRNSVAMVTLLLQKKADVYARTDEGSCPLSEAARYNRASIATLLLDQMRCEEDRELYINPALLVAYQYKALNVFKLLLQNGANPNVLDYHGIPLLITASKQGEINIVSCLIEYNANVNIVSRYRHWTALHYAVDKGHGEIASLLIQAGAKNTKDEKGVLALIFKKIDTQKKINELHVASQQNNCKAIATLLKEKIIWDPNILLPALQAAIRNDDPDLIYLIIQQCPAICSSIDLSIMIARAYSHVLRTMLPHITERDRAMWVEKTLSSPEFLAVEMNMALCRAVRDNNLIAASIFIRSPYIKADFVSDTNHRTAFQTAISLHHAKIIRLFISTFPSLARRELEENTGYTLLHWAAQHGYLSLIEEWLAKHPKDIDLKTHQGDSLIALATRGNHLNVANWLLAREIDDSDASPVSPIIPAFKALTVSSSRPPLHKTSSCPELTRSALPRLSG